VPDRRLKLAFAARAAVLAVVLMPCLPLALAAAPPNILLITADTFRPDHLGYYGYGRDTSPQLDAFSREGVFFTQAFTTSGWTTPGLISIHTSLYAPTHGVDIRGRSIDPAVVTLAEALAAVGYRVPDIFFLTDIPNFYHLGLEDYQERRQYLKEGDEILFHWLEEEAPTSADPFFLYYHYRELHQPYAPGPEYDALYTPAAFGHPYNPLSHLRRFVAREKLDMVQREIYLPRGILDFAQRDRPWVSALYDGQIRRMDDTLFARLRRTLEKTGLAANTLVVVSADHGEGLLEHGLIGHVSTFKEARLDDEIIRIPLIFWFPEELPAGLRLGVPVQCIDIMPTLLELAGAPVPEEAQGQSLLPLMSGDAGWLDRPVYLETSGGGYTANEEEYAQRLRGIRTERWKLLHGNWDAVMLYDLAADPAEEENVAHVYPAVADSLQSLLNAWVLSSRARRSTIAGRESDQPRAPVVAARLPLGAEDGAPRVLFPADGDTLHYAGEEQTIQLEWTGDLLRDYVIEYSVGEGTYYLEGELPTSTARPSYGPFQAGFWNSLTLYNPWTFRVYPSGQADAASQWVTFHLAPSGALAGGFSSPSISWLIALQAVRSVLAESAHLARGLGLGLLDLYIWVSGVPPADLSAWVLLAAIVAAAIWPQVRKIGPDRCGRWGVALAFIALVYSTVPFFPVIWRRLTENTQGANRHIGIVLVVFVGIAVIARVWRRVRYSQWVPYVALAAIFAAYGYLLAVFGRFPAERLHLLEYGLVAVLLFRALALDLSRHRAYFAGFCLTVFIGIIDETIQWVLPQRFFELKDIQLNAVSGALGLLLAHFGQVARGQEENNEVTHRPITPAAVDERTGQGASRPAANPTEER
jgi:arylsulfatase A-like enzyme